ncbi:MAG: HD domain-containing protein [Campylobacterota bacterium]|nr:HD domain-containing protein [Campylobacterota bacterium]
MKKIVKQTINQEFLPVSPKKLAIDDVLDFDCFIKRFNGYAIILEAGTPITRELKEKIDEHRFLYVQQREVDQYRAYVAEKAELDEESEEKKGVDIDTLFENLLESLNACKDIDQQVALIYQTALSLMEAYFSAGNEEIMLKYIELYSDALIGIFDGSEYRLGEFLDDMPDSYDDASHNVNVSFLGVLLGRELGLSNLQLHELSIAGILHDIGKVRIDPKILNKDSSLDSDEFEAVQEHSVFSVEIAKYNGVSSANVLSAIRYHHEKLDGSGYPEGLEGNKIPLMAQMIGICDIFDALTTDHTFRARYSSFDALKLMKREMAQQLNGSYVNTFIKLLK